MVVRPEITRSGADKLSGRQHIFTSLEGTRHWLSGESGGGLTRGGNMKAERKVDKCFGLCGIIHTNIEEVEKWTILV